MAQISKTISWQDQAIALWGERWKSTLALTSGVTKRTVQRWNSGESKIDPWVKEGLQHTYNIWIMDKRGEL